MKIVLCIDDTDNLESRGTGELASILAREIEENSWGMSRFITRHQLLVHPDTRSATSGGRDGWWRAP